MTETQELNESVKGDLKIKCSKDKNVAETMKQRNL